MNIKRKDIVPFLFRLIPLAGILFLFTDMVGALFVSGDYTIRAWFRCKVVLFLLVFSSGFLVGSNILKWPVRQLAYIGYPIYLLIMAISGILTAPHDFLGYKIGLAVAPFVAQILHRHGKGYLRRYLRMISHFTGGRIICKKGILLVLLTLSVVVLSIIAVYHMRGACHFNLRQYCIEHIPIAPKVIEKPCYDPNRKDRRDPYRNYSQIFRDLNDTQLIAARQNGTPRVLTLEELELKEFGLRRIESNKLYKVDPLTHSAPYLVPKAEEFLADLGDAFQDSLYNRGYDRRHRFIVTSVYRTKNHIKRLQRSGNVNASQNSCHQYGTTVDITYVRFDKPDEHRANDPKLLQLLMQTVYDMHRAGRCYVKYEHRQKCLHITVR